MQKLFFTIVLAAAFLPSRSLAQSVTIFNNLGPGDTVDLSRGWSLGHVACSSCIPPDPFAIQGEAFIPTTSAQLDRIDLAIKITSGVNQVDVFLRTDSSGPKSVIESFHFSSANGLLSAHSVSKPLLAAGTRYWLTAQPSDSNSTALWSNNSVGETGLHASTVGGKPLDFFEVDVQTQGAFRVVGIATIPSVWPMSGRNAQRQGLSPFTGPNTAPTASAWTFAADTGPDPIVGDIAVSAEGNLYVASYNLYALKPDGSNFVSPIVWSSIAGAPPPGFLQTMPGFPPTRQPSPFLTGPAIDDRNGFVYIGERQTVAGPTGWTIVRYTKQLTSPTLIAMGFTGTLSNLVVGENGAVYFSDGTNVGAASTLVWRSSSTCVFSSFVGAPAVGPDGSVFEMCSGADFVQGGGLYKYDGTTGAQVQFAGYNRGSTEPMIDNQYDLWAGWQAFGGAIFCGAYDTWDQNLNKLTPTQSRCDNSADFTTSRATLAPDGSTVRIAYGFTPNKTLNYRGTHTWSVVSDSQTVPLFTSLPSSDGSGNIFIGTTAGVKALSNTDGSKLWEFPTSAPVTTQPVISNNGALYVGTSDGKVYAFGGSTGATPSTLDLEFNQDGVLPSSQGLLFSPHPSTITEPQLFSVSGGVLTVSPGMLAPSYGGTYVLNNGFTSNNDVNIEVRLKTYAGSFAPFVFFELADNQVVYYFTFGSDNVQVVTNSGTVIIPFDTTNGFHAYRLSSVSGTHLFQFFIDDVLKLSALGGSPVTETPRGFSFGGQAFGPIGKADIDYIRYNNTNGLTAGSLAVTTNLDAATFTITGPATFMGSGKSFMQGTAPTGAYTINYGSVNGYTAPASETKTLTANGIITFTGTYQQQLSVGTITITSNRPEASFTLSPTVQGLPSAGPYPVTSTVPTGTYTVTFRPISGFTTPLFPPQTLIMDGFITFAGIYLPILSPSLVVSPTSLAFSYLQGVAGPIVPQTLSVFSSGAPLSFTASASTTPAGGSWLSVSGGGTTPQSLSVNVSQGLAAGTYNGQIGITSANASNSLIVPVTLTVAPPVATTGTITVTSNPSGAGFQLAGPGLTLYSGITPFTTFTAPPGDYKITWNTLLGDYTRPASETKHLDAGIAITFIGTYTQLPPKPIVLVVPGLGASTLQDSSGNNQWLSCTSSLSLHSGNVMPLQYDSSGNAISTLTPSGLLLQGDSVPSDVIKPSNTSILQCNNADLSAFARAAGFWGGAGLIAKCFSGFASDPHECAQTTILSNADGALLQFNVLLASLTSGGYNPVGWGYDFRRDISAVADDLYNEVHQVSALNPGRAIDIVTHSEGSLVTAAMIQQHPDVYNSGLLQQVISMGAPFSGSIDTYLYMQGWQSFLPFLSSSNTKQMGQNWTSAYQVLPQWDFVTPVDFSSFVPTKYEIFDGRFNPTDFPQLPRASIIPDLAQPASLWSRIASLPPLTRWHGIIGQGKATANQLVEKLDAGNYKPCFVIDRQDGDGTVPLRSAQASLIVPPSNRIFVQDVHSHLPQNNAVIQGILNLLSGASPFSVVGLSASAAPFTRQDTIIVNACSPISLTVTDSGGNVLNSQVTEIQNAMFSNIGEATQVEVPWNDTFQVQVAGTGNGTFDLLVNGLGGQHSPLKYFFKAVPVQNGSQGTVTIGNTSVPSLQYNYSGRGAVDTIPANVSPPTIQCTGGYFFIQGVRASLSFNVGYQGAVSTFAYNLRNTGTTIQFSSATTSQIAISGKSATFSGQGMLNGQAGYSFSVTATDGGGPGSGLDSVAVSIFGPNNYSYTASSSLVGGDIVVHP